MTTYRAASILMVMLLPAPASSARAADLDLSWNTIDAGGGYCAGGDFDLEGTIGQPDAGYVSGGDFELSGGFWRATTATPDPCGLDAGDLDGNGRVDLIDYSTFSACFTGPGVTAGPGCTCADLDGDGDVDLTDFSSFSTNFTG